MVIKHIKTLDEGGKDLPTAKRKLNDDYSVDTGDVVLPMTGEILSSNKFDEIQLGLFQKLTKIRNTVNVVEKNENGYGYKYASLIEILAKVTGAMNTNKVSLIPILVPGTVSVEKVESINTKVSKQTGEAYQAISTEMLVKADMEFRWLDNETGAYFDVPWVIIGSQTDPSQAFGSGLTYCTRYFLTNYFQIAQDNDPDKYIAQQKEAEEHEEREILAETKKMIDTHVRNYLASNPDKKEEIARLVGRYDKKQNYNNIKEPMLASALLGELKKDYPLEVKEEK